MSDVSPIAFVDIPAQYGNLRDELLTGIARLIDQGAFVGGPVLEQFEQHLAEYVGTKYAIGCSDGTTALQVALLAAGIKQGDKVVVPSNSFIASANAVVHAGGVPVLIDCTHDSFLIDLSLVEDALRNGAQFVLPVHLYGNPCPMDELINLCEKYGAFIIEDNAQALGSKFGDRRTGSFGLAAGVSFYPAKNLGAFGQGGAILTNDASVARRARLYIEQGQGEARYHHEVIGYNGRLHTIQALILDILLGRLDDWNQARREIASIYASRLLDDHIQKVTAFSEPVFHLFEFRCSSKSERDILAQALRDNDIGFGYHYPVPIHKQKAYWQYNNLSLPVCESLAETLISLPIHPNLAPQDAQRVCDLVVSLWD